MRRTTVIGLLSTAVLAGGIATATPAAAGDAGQVLDIKDKGAVSQSAGTATVTVTVKCLQGEEAHLDVELSQDDFTFGTYDVTYFTCTGKRQKVEIVYDGGTYPVPHAGEAYVLAYLEMPGYGVPEDLYGEWISMRSAR